jgi:hypothetical protein
MMPLTAHVASILTVASVRCFCTPPNGTGQATVRGVMVQMPRGGTHLVVDVVWAKGVTDVAGARRNDYDIAACSRSWHQAGPWCLLQQLQAIEWQQR